MYYSVYGVTLASDLPLTLPLADKQCTQAIRLQRGDDGAFHLARNQLAARDPYDWAQHVVLDDGSIYLHWQDWLELIVSSDGRQVQYGPLTEPLESFEAYLANFAVSSALIQQGEEPLHATVVDVAKNGLGFLGHSGAGKSTLAAFFLSQGARLITDDMLRVTFGNGQVFAQPGPLRIKLFKEPAARYLESAICHGRWNPLASKYIFEPGDPRARPRDSRLSALFWLEPPNDNDPPDGEVRINRLRGLELFKILSASTMNYRLTYPARLSRQLAFATRVGNCIPVYRLAYKRSLDVFHEVARKLRYIIE